MNATEKYNYLLNNKQKFLDMYGHRAYDYEVRSLTRDREAETIISENKSFGNYSYSASKLGYLINNKQKFLDMYGHRAYDYEYSNLIGQSVSELEPAYKIYDAVKDDYAYDIFKGIDIPQYTDTDEDRVRQATGLVPSHFNINEALKGAPYIDVDGTLKYIGEDYEIKGTLTPDQLTHLMKGIEEAQLKQPGTFTSVETGQVMTGGGEIQPVFAQRNELIKQAETGVNAYIALQNARAIEKGLPQGNYRELQTALVQVKDETLDDNQRQAAYSYIVEQTNNTLQNSSAFERAVALSPEPTEFKAGLDDEVTRILKLLGQYKNKPDKNSPMLGYYQEFERISEELGLELEGGDFALRYYGEAGLRAKRYEKEAPYDPETLYAQKKAASFIPEPKIEEFYARAREYIYNTTAEGQQAILDQVDADGTVAGQIAKSALGETGQATTFDFANLLDNVSVLPFELLSDLGLSSGSMDKNIDLTKDRIYEREQKLEDLVSYNEATLQNLSNYKPWHSTAKDVSTGVAQMGLDIGLAAAGSGIAGIGTAATLAPSLTATPTGITNFIAPNAVTKSILLRSYGDNVGKYTKAGYTPATASLISLAEAAATAKIESLGGIAGGGTSKILNSRVFRALMIPIEEMGEEAAQAGITAIIENITLGTPIKDNPAIQWTPEVAAKMGLTVALTSALFGAANIGVDVKNTIQQNSALKAAESLIQEIDTELKKGDLDESDVQSLNEQKAVAQQVISAFKGADTPQETRTDVLQQDTTKPLTDMEQAEQEFVFGEMESVDRPYDDGTDTHRSALSLLETYKVTEYGAMLNEDIKKGKADYHVESAVPDMEQAINNVKSGKLRVDNYEAVEVNGEIKKYNKKDVVNLLALLDKAVKDGDTEAQAQITSAIYEAGLQLGRGVQAFALLKKSSPNVHLVTMQREIAKFNAEGRKKFGDKWTDVELTIEEQQAVLAAKTFEERTDIYQKFVDRIHDDLPSTVWQKIDQIRKTGMLFNIKTQLRNIGGNTIQMAANAVARKIEAGLQKLLPKEKRTQVFSIKPEYKKMVEGEWEQAKQAYQNYGRYNIEAKLGQGYQNAFKNKTYNILGIKNVPGFSKIMNMLTNATGTALDLGDIIFGKHHYETALASYMQAKGLKQVTPAAREYAMLRALEATFRAESKLATSINNLIKKGGAGGKAMSVVMPFVKTPINIAKQAFDYSPLGMSKSVTIDLYRVLKGKMSATQWIHNISKGLTGTGIYALGIMLAKGIIPGVGLTGAPPENEKEYALLKQQGWKPYSLRIGDLYFPVTWAQPFATPMMMGVTTAESMDDWGELDFWGKADKITEIVDVMIDSIAEVSPLSGVQKTLQGYGTVGEKLVNIGGDLASQMVPAMAKQVGQIIDPNVYDKYSGNVIEDTKSMFVKGIPGLDAGFEAAGIDTDVAQKVDAWGQPLKQSDNIFARIALNAISPSYASKETADPINQEIIKLHEETGNNSVFPKVVEKSIFKDVELINKELQELQEGIGQLSRTVVEGYINSAQYKKDDADTRAKTIKNLYDGVVELYREAKKQNVSIPSILKQAQAYAERYHKGEVQNPVMDARMLTNTGVPDELFDYYKDTGDDIFLLEDETFTYQGKDFEYPVDWQEQVLDELEATLDDPVFDTLTPKQQQKEIKGDIENILDDIQESVIKETPYYYLQKPSDGITNYDIHEMTGWSDFDAESEVISALDDLDILPKNPQTLNGVDVTDDKKEELAQFTFDLLDELDSYTKYTVTDTIDTAYDIWSAYQITGWDDFDLTDNVIAEMIDVGVKPKNAQILNGEELTATQKQQLAQLTYAKISEYIIKHGSITAEKAEQLKKNAYNEWKKQQ